MGPRGVSRLRAGATIAGIPTSGHHHSRPLFQYQFFKRLWDLSFALRPVLGSSGWREGEISATAVANYPRSNIRAREFIVLFNGKRLDTDIARILMI